MYWALLPRIYKIVFFNCLRPLADVEDDSS